jgi:hypothetical protein
MPRWGNLPTGPVAALDQVDLNQALRDISLSRIAANILGLAAGDSFRIPSDGQLQFGADVYLARSAADTLYIPDRVAIGADVEDVGIGLSIDITSVSAIKGYNTIIARQRGAVVSGPSSVQLIGASGEAWLSPANTQNWTHARGLVGLDGYVGIEVGATGTITGVDPVDASGKLEAALIVTNWRAFHSFLNPGIGTIVNYYGLRVDVPSAGTTITNIYGILVEDITGRAGAINRAILTQGGLVELIDPTAPLRLGYSAAKYASFAIDVNGILTITPDTGNAVVLDQSNRWRPAVNNGLDLGKNDIQWSSLYLGNNIYIAGSILFGTDGATINSPNIDATSLILKARDNGAGLVEIARFQGAADPYLEISKAGHIYPVTDGVWNCGDATHRWLLVRGVTVTSGDFRFENGWRMTEAERLGLGRGIALVRPNGEVARIWK